MDVQQIKGTAGPALAAHSKDASAAGQTPASAATGNGPEATGPSGSVRRVASQAQDTAGKIASSPSEFAGQAREQLSERGVTVEQAADFVREKPLTLLLAAGGLGVILGLLIARR